jgi:hypothetical protein
LVGDGNTDWDLGCGYCDWNRHTYQHIDGISFADGYFNEYKYFDGNSNGDYPKHSDIDGYGNADRSDLYQHPHSHLYFDPDRYPYQYINTHGYKHFYGDLVGDNDANRDLGYGHNYRNSYADCNMHAYQYPVYDLYLYFDGYPDYNGNLGTDLDADRDFNTYIHFNADSYIYTVLYSHVHLVFDPDCYAYQYINTHGHKHSHLDLVCD